MTLPRWDAIVKHYKRWPPLRIAIASWLGAEGEKPKTNGSTSEKEFVEPPEFEE